MRGFFVATGGAHIFADVMDVDGSPKPRRRAEVLLGVEF